MPSLDPHPIDPIPPPAGAKEMVPPWGIALLLTMAILAVYGQTAGFDFLDFDDDYYIFKNRMVSDGLTWPGWVWAWQDTGIYYMPISWLSLMTDVSLFGLNPGASHLVNVFWHLGNTLLLFSLLRRMTKASGKSAFVAACFALHPLHVEAVAWISERKEMLAAFFALLALQQYHGYTQWLTQPRTPTNSPTRPYLLAHLFFLLSLLAKPMWITLPCILLLLDWWPLARVPHRGWWPLIREKFFFFLFTPFLVISIVTAYQAKDNILSYQDINFHWRLLNLANAYLEILEKTLVPIGLSPLYPMHTIATSRTILAATLLIGVSWAAWRTRRRHPPLLVGWFWFLGSYLPVSGFINGGVLISWADRWTYLPHIGLFIALAWTIPPILVRLTPRLFLPTGGLLLILSLALLAWQQTTRWRNTEILWQHAIATQPNNHFAHFQLGRHYASHHRLEEGFQAVNQAIRLLPQEPAYPLELGHILMDLDQPTAALNAYHIVLHNPLSFVSNLNDAGTALLYHHHLEEAVPFFQEAITRESAHPDSPPSQARIFLAVALIALDRVTEATAILEPLRPTNPAHGTPLCHSLIQLGQMFRITKELLNSTNRLQLKCPS